MFHSKILKNKISRLHEKALQLVYINKSSHSFEDLLKKRCSSEYSPKNLKILATEIYTVKNGLAPDIMKDIQLISFLLLACNMRQMISGLNINETIT